jgi:hypothetical protein
MPALTPGHIPYSPALLGAVIAKPPATSSPPPRSVPAPTAAPARGAGGHDRPGGVTGSPGARHRQLGEVRVVPHGGGALPRCAYADLVPQDPASERDHRGPATQTYERQV